MYSQSHNRQVPYDIILLSNYSLYTRLSSVFQYLMKLHYSQTNNQGESDEILFQYLMKLHYSQTMNFPSFALSEFQYLMKLHYSQTIL